jgi:hypothetical protein
LGRGSLRPPAASRCSARKLAARSFPRRPPAYVLNRRRRRWALGGLWSRALWWNSGCRGLQVDTLNERPDRFVPDGPTATTVREVRSTHRGGSPREGARSELASGAATGGGGPQAPPTRSLSRAQAPPTQSGIPETSIISLPPQKEVQDLSWLPFDPQHSWEIPSFRGALTRSAFVQTTPTVSRSS